tara:strand:- start:3828 stop:4589 length:762 start_codon:yes stop_codon:yes gene_type:complete
MLKKFKKDGFVKLNPFTKNQIDQLNKALFCNLIKISGERKKLKFTYSNLQKLIAKTYKNKKTFKNFYEFSQNQVQLYLLSSNKKLLNYLSKILNVREDSFILGDMTLRIDNPGVSNAALDMHQESTYYPEIKNYDKTLLVWFPLHDINKGGGGLGVCTKKFNKKINSSWNGREYSLKESFKPTVDYTFTGKKGEALICNFNLFHCTTLNSTNNFRLSCAFRYHSSFTKNFKPFRKWRVNKIFFQKLKENQIKF